MWMRVGVKSVIKLTRKLTLSSFWSFLRICIRGEAALPECLIDLPECVQWVFLVCVIVICRFVAGIFLWGKARRCVWRGHWNLLVWVLLWRRRVNVKWLFIKNCTNNVNFWCYIFVFLITLGIS
ncbi:hypothetical protein TRFO_33902 [Tritrichomonas foetus]|uniref:Uncharacterized protein n=1 Tax=Tritrichomonas foetus TaxID=1144522 RepID=A0A1J4JLP5_9EUKA|nr:hypothetical protein TRFO_33902 [Tritrichomonas foetus]|eukprot:OHS99609.1 hypothetical protein TRFO_33902 [Tritrichomonas foetus]